MTAWKKMIGSVKRLMPGRRRRSLGPVAKVGLRSGMSLREQYERADNPLQGIWGPDPNAWLDQLRSKGWERS